MRPVTVHLVQHAHTDIGYTAHPSQIERLHLDMTRKALDICESDDDFRWTVEVSWTMERFLDSASSDDLFRFEELARTGRIEACGQYLHPTPLWDLGAWIASYRPVLGLRDMGIPVRTAMNCDVNGVPATLPTLLSQVGIEHYILAAHVVRGRPAFRRPYPFNWEAPDGSSVLAMSGHHYMTLNFFMNNKTPLGMEEDRFREFVSKSLEGYDHDHLLVQFSGYFTDNSPPNPDVTRMVDAWNDVHDDIRLLQSTPSSFMDAIKGSSKGFDVHSGEWTDWWCDGVASAPLETAIAREAQRRTVSAELISGIQGWEDTTDELWKQNLLYGEHTFGYHASISRPEHLRAVSAWNRKAAYAFEPYFSAQSILGGDIHDDTTDVWVFNPNTREVVDILWEDTFDARYIGYRVPPFGNVSAYPKKKDDETPPTPDHVLLPVRPDGNGLDNGILGAVVADDGTVTSCIDVESGKELIEPGWNAYIHRTVKGNWEDVEKAMPQERSQCDGFVFRDDHAPLELEEVVLVDSKVEAKDDSIEVLRTFSDGTTITTHYLMLPDVPRLFVENVMVRDGRHVPEMGHFVFGHNTPSIDDISYAGPGGMVALHDGQLPGTARSFHSVQDHITVGTSLHLSVPDSPITRFGSPDPNRWTDTLEPSDTTIYSEVLNNHWWTNFRAHMGGRFRFRYSLSYGDAPGRPLVCGHRPLNDMPVPFVVVEGELDVVRVIPGPGGPAYILSVQSESVRLRMNGPCMVTDAYGRDIGGHESEVVNEGKKGRVFGVRVMTPD